MNLSYVPGKERYEDADRELTRSQIPLLVVWNPADHQEHNNLQAFLSDLPTSFLNPLLLVALSDSEKIQRLSPPSHFDSGLISFDYNLQELVQDQIYLAQVEQPLYIRSDDLGSWSAQISNTAEDAAQSRFSVAQKLRAFLGAYQKVLDETGAIVSFAKLNFFPFHHYNGTPVINGSHLSINEIHAVLLNHFGKPSSLWHTIWPALVKEVEDLTDVDLNYFHRGKIWNCLYPRILKQDDVLSFANNVGTANDLVNGLLQSDGIDSFTLKQLAGIVRSIESSLLEKRKIHKIWLINATKPQVFQLLDALQYSFADNPGFTGSVKVYITKFSDEAIANFQEWDIGRDFGSTIADVENLPLLSKENKAETFLDSPNTSAWLKKLEALRFKLAIHAQHNIFIDPYYRKMDTIVCLGLLSGVVGMMRETLIDSLARSVGPSGALYIHRKEFRELHESVMENGFEYCSQVRGLIVANPKSSHHIRHRRKADYADAETSIYPNEDIYDSDFASFVINAEAHVFDARGNIERFCKPEHSGAALVSGQSLIDIVREDLERSINDLLSNRHSRRERRQMVVGESGVVLATLSLYHGNIGILGQQLWRLVIEDIEDIDLYVPVEKLSAVSAENLETWKLVADNVSETNIKHKLSSHRLERLNLELASLNDRLSEQSAQHLAQIEEARNTNSQLLEELRVARQSQKRLKLFLATESIPRALVDQSGHLVSANELFLNSVCESGLNRGALVDIFDERLALPVKTLRDAMDDAFLSGQCSEFSTRLNDKLVVVKCSSLSVGESNNTLIELVESRASQVEELDVELFAEILQKLNISTLLLDESRSICSFDQIMQTWLDNPSIALLGKSVDGYIAPDYRSLFLSKWEQATESGFAEFEAPLIGESHKLVWCRFKLSRLSEPSGLILMLMENIVEHHRTQKETLTSQKMESLGLLTGGIAHDFNNILSIVIGYVDLLWMDANKAQNEDDLKRLNAIKAASERGKLLIKQMLYYSRGDDRTEIAQFDVNNAVKNILPLLKSSFSTKAQLSTQLCSANAVTDIDPTHLDQIIMNLCINARDAVASLEDLSVSREGEITLSVNVESEREGLTCSSCQSRFSEKDSNWIVIRVTDNGTGIDSKVLEHIFDPFYSTKEVGKGTGMGLSVVHGLVHQYNGHIQVFSSNYGAQFAVWLPVSEKSEVLEPEPVAKKQSLHFPDWKILLVEDDPMVAAVTESIFQHLGLRVSLCRDGTEAQELLRADKQSGLLSEIDLIITDQAMPKMGGVELVKWCASEAIQIPTIVVTGNVGGLEDEELPDHVIKVLSKPVNVQSYVETFHAFRSHISKGKPDSVDDVQDAACSREPELEN